jgi:hypothetical protein
LLARLDLAVMAGLVPAIHVFAAETKDVDARHKAGHDESVNRREMPHIFDLIFHSLRCRRPACPGDPVLQRRLCLSREASAYWMHRMRGA